MKRQKCSFPIAANLEFEQRLIHCLSWALLARCNRRVHGKNCSIMDQFSHFQSVCWDSVFWKQFFIALSSHFLNTFFLSLSYCFGLVIFWMLYNCDSLYLLESPESIEYTCFTNWRRDVSWFFFSFLGGTRIFTQYW